MRKKTHRIITNVLLFCYGVFVSGIIDRMCEQEANFFNVFSLVIILVSAGLITAIECFNEE